MLCCVIEEPKRRVASVRKGGRLDFDFSHLSLLGHDALNGVYVK
jgi:hypothetical protein